METAIDVIFKITLIPIGIVTLYFGYLIYKDTRKPRAIIYHEEPTSFHPDTLRIFQPPGETPWDAFWSAVIWTILAFLVLGFLDSLLFKGIAYLLGIPFLGKP